MNKKDFAKLVCSAIIDDPRVASALTNPINPTVMVDLKDGSVFQLNIVTVEEPF